MTEIENRSPTLCRRLLRKGVPRTFTKVVIRLYYLSKLNHCSRVWNNPLFVKKQKPPCCIHLRTGCWSSQNPRSRVGLFCFMQEPE